MYPIIDCHCHIYPEKVAYKAVQGIGSFYDIPMNYDGKLETLLKENEANGVVHSIIFSVATKPEQSRSINKFISDNVNANPQRFTGLGAIHPDTQDAKGDVEDVIAHGLKGIKLHHDFQHVALDDPRCLKIYELCEGKLPVLFHTGDKRYDFSNPDRLERVLKLFPNLTIIGAHFGGYSLWNRVMEKLGGYKNLFVDCSSSLAFMSPEKGKELVRFFGADKVIFGTDFPMWSIGEEIARVEALGLNEEEKQKIYYKNALSLFSINKKI